MQALAQKGQQLRWLNLNYRIHPISEAQFPLLVTPFYPAI